MSISKFLKEGKKRKKKKKDVENMNQMQKEKQTKKGEMNNIKWNMLFNGRDFCGMANHFAMLGLSKVKKLQKSVDNISCRYF